MADNCASLAIATQLLHWPTAEFDRLTRGGCNCSSINADNNMSNLICQAYPFYPSWFMQVFYISLFIITISSAIIGNSVVLWVILWHRRMRTVTNYFLLNLAVADLSITIFNVCFMFQFNLYFNWWFGSSYCNFANFMAVTPTCASVFTMVSMSLDRYMAIVHPLRPRLSKRRTITAIVSIWLLASLCGLPHGLTSRTSTFFFFDQPPVADGSSSYNYYYKITTCIGDNFPDGYADTSRLYAWYNNFLLAITYIVPLLVLTATYSLMGRVLWGAQAIGDHRQEESIQAKRKVVKMMIVIVSVFMVCWLPYHLYFTVLMGAFARLRDPMNALYIYLNIYWLAMTSTVFNPLICAYMNTRFRMGFSFVFRWVPCVGLTRRDYEESELVRDPRKPSVSGLYRLRSVALPKRRLQTGPMSEAESSEGRRGTRESQLGGENGGLLEQGSGERPSTVDLPSALDDHSDSGFDPHSLLP